MILKMPPFETRSVTFSGEDKILTDPHKAELLELQMKKDELEREFSKYLGQQSRAANRQRKQELEVEIDSLTKQINKLKQKIRLTSINK